MIACLLLAIAPLPSKPELVRVVASDKRTIIVRSAIGHPATMRMERDDFWPGCWHDVDGDIITITTYRDMPPGTQVIIGIKDGIGAIQEYKVGHYLMPD